MAERRLSICRQRSRCDFSGICRQGNLKILAKYLLTATKGPESQVTFGQIRKVWQQDMACWRGSSFFPHPNGQEQTGFGDYMGT